MRPLFKVFRGPTLRHPPYLYTPILFFHPTFTLRKGSLISPVVAGASGTELDGELAALERFRRT